MDLIHKKLVAKSLSVPKQNNIKQPNINKSFLEINNPGEGDCGYYSFIIGLVFLILKQLQQNKTSPLLEKLELSTDEQDKIKIFDFNHIDKPFWLELQTKLRGILLERRKQNLGLIKVNLDKALVCQTKDSFIGEAITAYEYKIATRENRRILQLQKNYFNENKVSAIFIKNFNKNYSIEKKNQDLVDIVKVISALLQKKIEEMADLIQTFSEKKWQAPPEHLSDLNLQLADYVDKHAIVFKGKLDGLIDKPLVSIQSLEELYQEYQLAVKDLPFAKTLQDIRRTESEEAKTQRREHKADKVLAEKESSEDLFNNLQTLQENLINDFGGTLCLIKDEDAIKKETFIRKFLFDGNENSVMQQIMQAKANRYDLAWHGELNELAEHFNVKLYLHGVDTPEFEYDDAAENIMHINHPTSNHWTTFIDASDRYFALIKQSNLTLIPFQQIDGYLQGEQQNNDIYENRERLYQSGLRYFPVNIKEEEKKKDFNLIKTTVYYHALCEAPLAVIEALWQKQNEREKLRSLLAMDVDRELISTNIDLAIFFLKNPKEAKLCNIDAGDFQKPYDVDANKNNIQFIELLYKNKTYNSLSNEQEFVNAHFKDRWFGLSKTVKTANANDASINYLIKNRRYVKEVFESKNIVDIFAACDDDAFIQLFTDLSKRRPAILIGKAADINGSITVAAELLSGQPQAVHAGVLKLAVSIRRNSKVALAAYTYLKNQYEKSKDDAKQAVHGQLVKLITASKIAAKEFLTNFKTHKWNWSMWKRESILQDEEIKAFAKAYWGDTDIQPLMQKKYPLIINQMFEDLKKPNLEEANLSNENSESKKPEGAEEQPKQVNLELEKDPLIVEARKLTAQSQLTTEKQKEFLQHPIILAYIAKEHIFSSEVIWQFLSNQDLSKQFQLLFPITRERKKELFAYLKELPESEQEKIKTFRDTAVADSYFATVSRDLKMLQSGRTLYAENPNRLFAIQPTEEKGQENQQSPEKQETMEQTATLTEIIPVDDLSN